MKWLVALFSAIFLYLAVAPGSTLASSSYSSYPNFDLVMRANPYPTSKVTKVVKKHEPFKVIWVESKNWIKVQTTDGKIGFLFTVYTDYKPSTSDKKIAMMIEHAKSIKPLVKYQYGGQDSKRLIFDCSAFTQYLFNRQGITIPRTSAMQANIGLKINTIAGLKRGDLVLSRSGESKVIGHVGLYIGDGKMIHNLNSKMDVQITNLNTSSYYRSHFVSGSRVLY
jgi:hypothetical protein